MNVRQEVKEQTGNDVSYFISLFPKDYSDGLLRIIETEMRQRFLSKLNAYKDAFCEEKDICPICITGGWNCDSDHK